MEKFHQEKFDQLLEQYPILNNDDYCHKKEQLYLMVTWNLSDEMIYFLLNNPILSQDMDFFRYMLILTKSIDFVKDTFYEKEFLYEDGIDLLVNHLVKTKYPITTEIEKLKSELEYRKKEYDCQMNFLKEQFLADKKYLEREKEQLNQFFFKEKELQARECENMRLSYERDIEKLQDKIKLLENNLSNLSVTSTEQPTLSPKTKDYYKTNGFERVFNGINKKNKLATKKEKFILSVLQNPDLSVEQLKIITKAFYSGVPLSDIKVLTNPRLKLDNLNMLLELLLSKNGVVLPAIQDEYFSKEKVVLASKWNKLKLNEEELELSDALYDDLPYLDEEE